VTAAPRVVYGLRPVTEVLRARPGEVQAVFLAEGRRPDRDLGAALEQADVKPEARDAATLDRLAAGGNHQGVLAVVGEFRYTPLETLLQRARAAPAHPLVILDQVQDPRNLGAILRSAYVLGAAGVILPERRSAAVTAAVVRTSVGATEHLAIARVVNLARALEAVREAGYWTFGAVGEGGQAPERCDLKDHAALVMGSEGTGLRRQTLTGCDVRVTIPMDGALGSLNVGIATALLLYEAARQRRISGSAPAL
jgi:23S rRNA (guanosine2251-2'-O)-methyltransferase